MIVVDAVCNLFTPEVVSTRPHWSATHMRSRFAVDPTRLEGVQLQAQLDEMDASGIDHAILVVQQMGAPGTPGHWSMDARPVFDAIVRHPERFSGQIGIDPTAGIRGVRALRTMVRDHGFVGAHFYPHWFDMSPDAAAAFPYYAACAELGVPIQVQVGQSMVYSKERPLRSVGLPMTLEPIALEFPELALIGSHLGYPWVDEMIALTTLYPNMYLCTDSYAPRYWPESLNGFVAGPGAGKVMFGTMWPTVPFDRAVRDIGEKGIPPAALEKYMGGVAQSVYKLN
jgi:predicted TIM-barrel fold metal-dependent hydrolase